MRENEVTLPPGLSPFSGDRRASLEWMAAGAALQCGCFSHGDGEYVEARGHYEEALGFGSIRATAHLALLCLEEHGGRFEEAVEWIRRGIAMAGSNPGSTPAPDPAEGEYDASKILMGYILRDLRTFQPGSVWAYCDICDDCINSMRWDYFDYIWENPFYGRIVRAWIDVHIMLYKPSRPWEEAVLFAQENGVRDGAAFIEWCRESRPKWFADINSWKHGPRMLKKRLDWDF